MEGCGGGRFAGSAAGELTRLMLFQDLNEALAALHSDDDARAEAAAQALQAMDGAVAALAALLADGDESARWWACRALSLQPTDGAVGPLIGALNDPDEDVQVCAMLALAEQRASLAIPNLVEKLRAPGGYVARQAEAALRRLGDSAEPALIAALTDENPQVRGLAARALAHLTTPAAIGPLYAALQDESQFVRYWADEGLTRRGLGMVLIQP